MNRAGVIDRSTQRSLLKKTQAHTMSHSQAFQASNVGRSNLGEGVDPFLQIDHFRMSQPVFPPHPHAGFSALTYMFEDSEGSFVNRDSISPEESVLIHPGDLHWTQAGSGTVHEEVPAELGVVCHGLQIFVNLAAVDKFSQPQAFHLSSADIPVYEVPGQKVRVVMGSAFDLTSPLETATSISVLDVTLSAGEKISHAIPADRNAFVLVIKGHGNFCEQRLEANSAGLFDNAAETVSVQAGAQDLQYVLFSGKPIDEPIYAHGPFVMNSAVQIQQAHARYMAGQMGALE